MGKPQESDTGQFCALPAPVSVLPAPAPQPAQRQLISRRKEITAMLHVRIDLLGHSVRLDRVRYWNRREMSAI